MSKVSCQVFSLYFVLSCLFMCGSSYYVTISHDGPVVQGATITFEADLYTADGSQASGTFRYTWEDNAIMKHTWQEKVSNSTSVWKVTYPANAYYPGEYEVAVNVDRFLLFPYPICSRRVAFNITALLNGNMDLVQHTAISSVFVSNTQPVLHEISLSKPDYNYLVSNATQVFSYWFVDCVFYGLTDDFTFNYTYTSVGKEHDVEALIVASYEPITTPQPTTTTSTSTVPPSTSNSTFIPTTTPVHFLRTPQVEEPAHKVLPASVGNNIVESTSRATMLSNFSVPYICLNSSIIPPDPKKTYGYFHRHLIVKSPIQNISVSGTNWLQQSEVLDLQIYCNGSSLFRTCDYIASADYNVTGKETCVKEEIRKDCNFSSHHYSIDNYTMVIIISNDVSKVVYPVRVTIYQAQKRAQLSVIVVPVACSIFAVVIIVFGVAYYVQSKKRYTVEVADFDFGQEGGDLEYKTFRERLREAVVNSFNRDIGMDGDSNVWSPSRKYGSMQ